MPIHPSWTHAPDEAVPAIPPAPPRLRAPAPAPPPPAGPRSRERGRKAGRRGLAGDPEPVDLAGGLDGAHGPHRLDGVVEGRAGQALAESAQIAEGCVEAALPAPLNPHA